MTKYEKAKALVAEHGSLNQAAKKGGIPRTTLRRWLNSRNSSTVEEQVESSHSLLLEQQQETIDAFRKGFHFPVGRKRAKGKTFIRVIVPDTHGCYADKEAVAAFLSDMDSLTPAEVVFLGDHLDCSGFLAKHHPFSTIQESRYTYAEDVAAANTFLDEVQQRAGACDYHYLEGNHEQRVEKWVVEQAPQTKDQEAMYNLFCPEQVLELKKRRIQYYRRNQTYQGLRTPGVIKLGDCYFCHGVSHAKNAAAAHLARVGRNVVFGHVHRRMQQGTTNVHTEYDAWCPGCLCQVNPVYGHGSPTDWSHGYGVQVVSKDGGFFHVNVPIVNGISYLRNLLGG